MASLNRYFSQINILKNKINYLNLTRLTQTRLFSFSLGFKNVEKKENINIGTIGLVHIIYLLKLKNQRINACYY